MKIVSWNVNGLAACLRKGFLSFLRGTDADIVCVQEVRSKCEIQTPGYYQFWNLAKRQGYAGTLILTRQMPKACIDGTGIEALDIEGRMLSLEFEDFFVINVYFPNTWGEPERRDYRRAWEEALIEYLEQLPKPAILAGDFNVGHEFIDIYPENQRNQRDDDRFDDTAEHRQTFDQILELGFTDAFRYKHPKRYDAYTWWAPKNNNRAENRGSRLDYFLVSTDMIDSVRGVWHHTDEQGSDHCPISMVVKRREKPEEESEEALAKSWQEIDWVKYETELEDLQERLSYAAYHYDWKLVRELQTAITESQAARCLAVRFVANKKAQAGVDGVKVKTDADKMRAVKRITVLSYRPLPFRYQEMEEHGKTIVVHVPATQDKIMLKLQCYALDPVAESLLEKRCFSGRRGRSALDAHSYLIMDFGGGDPATWAVKVDIKAYYKSTLHRKVLEVTPMDRGVLRKSLRAGMIKGGELFATNKGISYASPLSPIIGNLLINGLQSYIYDCLYPDGHRDYKGGSTTKFADDIIVAARSREQAEQILQIVYDFLTTRGLTLSPEKTYIADMREGFDFLGRHYRQLNGTLIVSPSEASVKKCEHDLEKLIMHYKGPQRKLIEKINKKLTGFGGYHRIEDAYMQFRHIDAVVEALLVQRLCERYPRWHEDTLLDKYWIKVGHDHIFALPHEPTTRVTQLARIGSVEHKPVSLNFNPYLDRDYYEWLQGRRDIEKASGKYKPVWKRQEGRCAICGMPMLKDEEIKIVERNIGLGHKISNLAYIHRECEYDAFSDVEGAMAEPLDVVGILADIMEEAPAVRSPYWELREYFRTTEKTPLSLTFSQIEEIIGDSLGEDAYHYEAFWFDDMPGKTSPLWQEEGYPFDEAQEAAPGYCIAEAWLSQGYRIKRLHLTERRVVFQKHLKNRSGLVIPKALLETKLPDEVVYEINQYLKYTVKKLGL